jgi:hypothetical protein
MSDQKRKILISFKNDNYRSLYSNERGIRHMFIKPKRREFQSWLKDKGITFKLPFDEIEKGMKISMEW